MESNIINAIFTNDENRLVMIEINSLVYPVNKKQHTIEPKGNTCFIQELSIQHEYIEITKDQKSYIVGIQFEDSTINEFRVNF